MTGRGLQHEFPVRYQQIHAETQPENKKWVFSCSENHLFLNSSSLKVFGRKISSWHIDIISYYQIMEFRIYCCLTPQKVEPVVVISQIGSTYAEVSFSAS